GQPPDAAQQRGEVFAIDVFHRQEVQPLGLAYVEDAADVRVRHMARDADFAVKARQGRAVRRQAFGEQLQGDRLRELEVVGAVDFAHAAAAQQADDAVTPGEHRAG